MIKLFDTHFHLDEDDTLHFDEVLNEAKLNHVEYLTCIGGDFQTSFDASLIASRYDNIWFTAGVHPHSAEKYDGDLKKFNTLSSNLKCVAIGEIGLDYYYEFSKKETQKEVFNTFCLLGNTLNKPLVIHCRDKEDSVEAYNDLYDIIRRIKPKKFVLHCFAGSVDFMRKILDIGGYIGITGIVTFTQAENIREIAKLIPMDRLLIETDAPYLAPKPYRGKKNHPKYLKLIAEKIAEVKKISLEELAFQTTRNAFEFYTQTP